MADAPPQLLLSGVNRGANLGLETVFSGTVGGAMTGMLLGIPSIALSQAWTDRANVRWETAASLGARRGAAAVGDRLAGHDLPQCEFPGPAGRRGRAADPRRARAPALSRECRSRAAIDPRGLTYHWVSFRRGPREQGPQSDVEAVRAGPYRRDAAALRPHRRGGLPMLARALPEHECTPERPERGLMPEAGGQQNR